MTDVSPGHWRLQAVKIKLLTSSLLLINPYFPTDPQRDNAESADLLHTLSNIKRIIEVNPCDNILWAGDINSDFSCNTNHTRAVQEALHGLGFLGSWNQFEADFTCTHELLGQTFTCLLDHFFWNTVLANSVTDAGCCIFLGICLTTVPYTAHLTPPWSKNSHLSPLKHPPDPLGRRQVVRRNPNIRHLWRKSSHS